MNLNYSIHEVDRAIIDKLKQCKNGNVLDTLKELLDFYKDLTKAHTMTTVDGIEHSIYSIFGGKIRRNCSDVLAIFAEYMNGNLIGCNKIINRLFKRTGCKLPSDFDFPQTAIRQNTIWYRMRNNEKCEEWECKELFHVPFEKRALIGSQRFSVPGYPSLYLGASVSVCMEEVSWNEAFSISSVRLNESIDVFDFTFFPQEGEGVGQFYNRLISYPIKIAISIPTNNDANAVFKPEYIIPQYILHSTIKQEKSTNKVKGFIYTSTKALSEEHSSEELKAHTNMVVPAMSISQKGYCQKLVNLFSITNPVTVKKKDILDSAKLKEIETNVGGQNFHKVKQPINAKN